MKNTKRILAMVFVLVFMFTVVMSSAVFAGTDKGKSNGKGAVTETEKVKGNDKDRPDKAESEKATVEEENGATGTENGTVEAEKEKAVKEKDKVMDQKKALTKQLIEARKSGNLEAAAELLAQIKEYKEQLKQMVLSGYTEEELAQLDQAAEAIEAEDPSVEVLPVESVVAKGRSLKLDMPPVIKDGKVLVPVRAFSRAYGAEVQWNQEEHTITIVKDGIEIVLKTDSSVVLVNGVETDLGMPVKGINGRTVMPIGFLAEKLGLKAEVDPEDGTIEIGDGEEEEDTTTGTDTTGTTTGN